MFLTRLIDNKIKELFRKGMVKGTVVMSKGNEATAVGMALPFRSGKDILSLLHRDLGSHLVAGANPYSLICQHLANADSPTHGREGNVHHGDALNRRFPMISHLGGMLPLTVGGVWAGRKNGEEIYGITAIGDGGASTGDFHEALNLASVQNVPVVFIVQNNNYAFSTPTQKQFKCKNISDRASGYGIPGKTINGLDPWEVYSAVTDSLREMAENPHPVLIEAKTIRLEGHAVYDTCDYISDQEKERILKLDPVPAVREKILAEGIVSEEELCDLEKQITEETDTLTSRAVACSRPNPTTPPQVVFCSAEIPKISPFSAKQVRNLNAINTALDHILTSNSDAFICGQDIGEYGSAFKTCKGLIKKHGPDRVLDFPICESGTAGFCLGASQVNTRPVMEFQFADFSTEAVTQVALNSGTWFYRTGKSAPILFRMPCGGGITLGAFHSAEYDGLWTRFPGIKLLYPVTPQETYEAILAGFYDPNPCIVLEHKLLYWGNQGDIEFKGDISEVFRPRQYTQGEDLTIVAMGAMVEQALKVVNNNNYSASVWNPFILNPLNFEPVLKSIEATGRLLVIQESGETAGLGDRFISLAVQRCFSSLKCAPVKVSAPDTPVPFAKELEYTYLPGQERIRCAIEKILGEAT
ncbi:Branched-chain alpha-keto acid dehydrogenase, E1 component, alpha subunit [Chitinispirillum alkaliphilum]|nr:Branched-chain alpha-keto acid dehydrogenase, E1 component, alpha subunit [Chitinispirillum alkaliphilum]